MDLEQLLQALKDKYFREPIDEVAALRAMEGVLAFLVQPENNTDANCQRADLFVTMDMDDVRSIQGPDVPDELGRILFDMMGLHDTHTAPDVAENFQATPDILLARTRERLATLSP
jgi:hypothetical protein